MLYSGTDTLFYFPRSRSEIQTMENGNLNQSLLDLLVAACRYALHVCLEGGGGGGKLANFFRYLTLPVLSFALGLIINKHYPVLLEA